MASLNKVQLIGNLGKDPKMASTPGGTQVAQVSIATTERWKDRESGELQEQTEWHRVVFYGRLAEVVGQYTSKGSAIYVEGKLRSRKWTDKDGIDRYTTEVVADEMQLLGGKTGKSDGEAEQKPAAKGTKAAAGSKKSKPAEHPPEDDDIPF